MKSFSTAGFGLQLRNHILSRALLRSTSSVLMWAVVIAFAVHPAYAQNSATQNDGRLEEITVTARKQSESLISVPVAVTVIGSTELNRYESNDLQKISLLAPQLIVTTAGSGQGAAFNIRGIGSSPVEPGLEMSVAVNIDGVQLTRGRIIAFSMFDLDQVEVLKGPQALFFGKNSPAGVISLKSAGPTDTFQSSVKAGYEFEAKERYVEGTVSGPVTDTLKARLAIRASDMSGWITNVSQPSSWPIAGPDFPLPGATSRHEPNGHQEIGRLTLDYEPTNAFDATLRLFGGDYRGSSDTGGYEAFCAPGVVSSTYGQIDPTGDCKLNGVSSVGADNPKIVQNWPSAEKGNGQNFTRSDLALTSLAMNFKTDKFTVTSVSSYTYLDYAAFDNFTFTTFPDISSDPNENSKSFSQELRAVTSLDGPLNFTGGGYFEDYNRLITSNTMIFFVGPDPRPGPINYHSWNRPAVNKGTGYSLFGQARWNIRDNVELTAGGRWSSDKRTVHMGNVYVNPAFSPAIIDLLPVGQFVDGTRTDTNFSPEVTLSWHPEHNSTLYAAYKTGYKAGGYANPGVLGHSYTAATVAYNPEVAKGGEIGYKAELLDRRLRVELTGYFYTYSNLQLSSFDNATFSYFIRNAGKARTKGVETSLEWRVSPELTLHSDIAYNRARYLSFPTAACAQLEPMRPTDTPYIPDTCFGGKQDLSGHPLTRAPSLVLNGGVSYDTSVGGHLLLGFSADARYTSSYFTDDVLTPYTRQQGFWLFDAGVKLHSDSPKWEVGLIGRNLSNQIYISQSQDQPGGGAGSWAAIIERTRQILLETSYHF